MHTTSSFALKFLSVAVIAGYHLTSAVAQPPELATEKKFAFEKQVVRQMELNEQGNLLVIVSSANDFGSDGLLQVWDIEKEKKVREQKVASRQVAISPDGQWVACLAESGKLVVQGTSDGKQRYELTKLASLKALRFVAEGRGLVAFGTAKYEGPSSLAAWKMEDGAQAFARTVDEPDVYSACIFSDGQTVALGTKGADVIVVKTSGAQQQRRVFIEDKKNLDMEGLAVSADGQILISSLYSQPRVVSDVQTGKKVKTLNWSSFRPTMEIFPDAKTVALLPGLGRFVLLVDIATDKQVGSLVGPSPDMFGQPPREFALSGNGRRLVAWDDKEELLLVWNTEKFAGQATAK
ncbi:WD40 repeat domain-containing protein [Anatilimnocola floriformis]|uniref:WD40 repeat domain-containing protein n=1 Tax=Anatilimnocola floriformis TaxID=2948575 RepID=UPI0020C1D101|nr:hypothetical protein [Anatilimnocola floriformis]